MAGRDFKSGGVLLPTGTPATARHGSPKDYVDAGDALAIPKSLFTAKGDLVVATASATAARLALGTDNYVLTADAAQAGGVKWAPATSGNATTTMAARIYRNATADSTSGTGARALTDVFDTTQRNDGMAIDLATGKITVAATGWHTVVGKLRTTAAQTVLPTIYVNGVVVARGGQVVANTVDFLVVANLWLTSGDYVQIGASTSASFGFQGDTVGANTFFSVVFNSSPIISGLLGHKATHYTGGADALTAANVAAQRSLTVVSTKTTNHSAADGEIVPGNTSGGGFTVTLPTAADGMIIVVTKTGSDTNKLSLAKQAGDAWLNGTPPDIILQSDVRWFYGYAGGWVQVEPVTKVQQFPPVALSDAATIATDASLGNHFRVTLGGNRTLGNPTNPTDGQVCRWELIQDGTGTRTITLGSAFALGTDITAVTLSTAINKRDFLTAVYNSTAAKWYVTAFIRGY